MPVELINSEEVRKMIGRLRFKVLELYHLKESAVDISHIPPSAKHLRLIMRRASDTVTCSEPLSIVILETNNLQAVSCFKRIDSL